MSGLRTDGSVSNAAGTGPVDLTGQSASKVRGTITAAAAVTEGFNISSATDNGVGSHSIDLTNAMNSSTYSPLHASAPAADGTAQPTTGTSGSVAVTSSQFTIITRRMDTGNTVDPVTITVAGHGDLA